MIRLDGQWDRRFNRGGGGCQSLIVIFFIVLGSILACLDSCGLIELSEDKETKKEWGKYEFPN